MIIYTIKKIVDNSREGKVESREKNKTNTDKSLPSALSTPYSAEQQNNVSSAVMKEVILPAIEEEVNHGKNFTQLRQICYSLMLAAWLKRKIHADIKKQIHTDNRRSLAFLPAIFSNYIDKKKIKGVDMADPQIKDKIYQPKLFKKL